MAYDAHFLFEQPSVGEDMNIIWRMVRDCFQLPFFYEQDFKKFITQIILYFEIEGLSNCSCSSPRLANCADVAASSSCPAMNLLCEACLSLTQWWTRRFTGELALLGYDRGWHSIFFVINICLFSSTPSFLMAQPLSMVSQIFCGTVSLCGSRVAPVSAANFWAGMTCRSSMK